MKALVVVFLLSFSTLAIAAAPNCKSTAKIMNSSILKINGNLQTSVLHESESSSKDEFERVVETYSFQNVLEDGTVGVTVEILNLPDSSQACIVKAVKYGNF